jgi:N-acetylglucosamine kinase-like BadF-type ATPase
MFTLAGADWPEDHTRRADFLAAAGLTRQVSVKNDTFGGMRAGLRKPYGMALAAGTGMNAAAIAPDGREWAFGYYENFGGAGTIVRDAFNAVTRAEDGRGQPTLLTGLLLNHLGYPSVEAMLRAWVLRQLNQRRFYTFTPKVFEAALQGDPAAVEIITRQGRGLAEYATALARRFEMTAIEFDVVLAGSVFKGVGPLLTDTITQEIHQVAPLARIVRPQFEPAVGSVLLAYDALGITVTEDIYTRLSETSPGAELFDTLGVVEEEG